MSDQQYDLVVIGSGPGGYVASIRASQLGLRTAVIEKAETGGVCGNWGCIPSKALLHQAEIFRGIKDLEYMGVSVDTQGLNYEKIQAKSRKAATKSGRGVTGLLKKNKVDLIQGTAAITGPKQVTVDGKTVYKAKNILIATGSSPRVIPGFEFDEKQVLSSTGILKLTELPKSLLILGAGAIGMEFAYVMNAFGVEVTIIEMMDHILPLEDAEVVKVVAGDFKKYGITMLTSTKANSLKKTTKGVTLEVEGKDGKKQELSAEKILVAIGRAPNSADLGLESLGIKTEKGFIKVGDYYQTDIPGIYAIGDVIASPLLAHVASKEGEIAVEHMAGHPPREKRLDPDLIPGATYTEPGVGSFGPSEEQAKERGLTFESYVFPYAGAGKTNAIEKPNGLVKILFDPNTKEILAGHVVGYQATELIHEILLAKKAELLPEDIATMVHAHPTISEAVMEAARGVEGWAIHI
ncbi:dihydrolipoyl dehydrogenase [Spirochaeta lutea]|uniref:Dihydrolipoyl dehydrogenase n=1 Tax=Spirochaeta lutea TaxID=1480694 RepID=A0A098R0E8_9SPIO|nr:dihydrolipoyl dehydrogenase [Spirochaeta lutea]KGE73163.1 dihydrolipoamide dehydrogenase [Spirochaeta lutea]